MVDGGERPPLRCDPARRHDAERGRLDAGGGAAADGSPWQRLRAASLPTLSTWVLGSGEGLRGRSRLETFLQKARPRLHLGARTMHARRIVWLTAFAILALVGSW